MTRVRSLPILWLSAGLAGSAALVLCLGSWSAWHSARLETSDQLESYVRYESLTGRQPAIDAAAKAYAGYLQVSASEDEALHRLLTTVEQVATRTGVQLASLAPRLSQRTDDTATFSVELDCTATAAAVAQFLHDLAGEPALLRVERFRINSAPQPPNTLQAQLLITYTQLL